MLSLTQIVKDGLEDLKRLKPLVEPHIDEWVVVMPPNDPAEGWAKENGIKVIVEDCTQEIEPEIRRRMAKLGIEVSEDYKLFNFAKARNVSLENATQDYIIWLDADDTPVGLENVKKYIEDNPNVDSFFAVYDYERDEEGNSASDHERERVFKNNGKHVWKGGELGLIHETALPIPGFAPVELGIPKKVFHVRHNSDHIEQSSLRNHAALLYEYLKTDGKDPRTTYYLGIEYFNRGMFSFCIQVLKEYITVGGSVEDRFNAYLKIAEAYSMIGDKESARNAFLEAQKEMPNRPESYLGVGEMYFEEQDYARAIEYTLTGLNKPLPKSRQAIDPMRYTFRPAGYLAQAYLQVGKPKKAYEWFVKCYKMNPNHPWVNQYKDLFLETKDLNDYVESFVKLAQLTQKYPKKLSTLAEVIPDDLMDQEVLMDFKWRYAKPKIWSAKSIVFFCSAAFEDWGPESMEKGCGGSEEAVIQLTKRLAKMGWEVTVYNNCIKEAIVDGVKWVRYERFNPRDMFNIIVSWRNNVYSAYDITASHKLIDMHDVPEGEQAQFYTKDLLEGVKIAVKSEYHKSLFDLPDDMFHVIPNGIQTDQFNLDNKVKNNLCWTSSYDRGLENLLKIWPEVRKEVPDVTLDIAYGWNLYDTTPWGSSPSGQGWKRDMNDLMGQEGITHHGRLSNNEVAKLYNKADVWAYPTRFKEIDCITATKAMAAKAVPIATEFAAIKERNQGVRVDVNPYTEEGLDKFRDELISLLKDEKRKQAIRNKLDVSSFDWDQIAERWNEVVR